MVQSGPRKRVNGLVWTSTRLLPKELASYSVTYVKFYEP